MDALTHVYLRFEDEPGRLRLVVDGFAETVGGSFIADASTPTANEIKRRTRLCAELFMEFHRDLKWATTRCLDELPRALRCKLDGIPFAPSREGRSSWGADNGRDLIWLPK